MNHTIQNAIFIAIWFPWSRGVFCWPCLLKFWDFVQIVTLQFGHFGWWAMQMHDWNDVEDFFDCDFIVMHFLGRAQLYKNNGMFRYWLKLNSDVKMHFEIIFSWYSLPSYCRDSLIFVSKYFCWLKQRVLLITQMYDIRWKWKMQRQEWQALQLVRILMIKSMFVELLFRWMLPIFPNRKDREMQAISTSTMKSQWGRPSTKRWRKSLPISKLQYKQHSTGVPPPIHMHSLWGQIMSLWSCAPYPLSPAPPSILCLLSPLPFFLFKL